MTMSAGASDCVDPNQSNILAQRELELKELEEFEHRWWSGPGGWKRKTCIALGKPVDFLFALREARKGVARYGNAIAQVHVVAAGERTVRRSISRAGSLTPASR